MRLLVIVISAIALTGQTAQAHSVGHNGKDIVKQYLYLKANLDHAQSFLAEVDVWKVLPHQHNVTVIADPDIKYHQNLARNSWNGILNLIPHRRQWKCIHHYEGSWQDSGSPYYGGLQMDLSFQRSYGYHFLASKGPANNWTPIEQMIVAEIAFNSRGFYPWPNTARYCGLI